MTLLQAVILAIVQGFTELFPISSLAHGVIMPAILHWNLDPVFLKDHFLPFMVMLHLGTALALLVYFGREWTSLGFAVIGRPGVRGETGQVMSTKVARRILILLIAATVPAALIGLIFESHLREHFRDPIWAASFLLVNGVLLMAGERARSRGSRPIESLKLWEAIAIGLAQSLGLIPGFSRSGASIVAGFLLGLQHEASARFSMLLATPIILGAGILEVPKLLHHDAIDTLTIAAIAGVAAGICAFISVWALMHWFRRNEINAMWPFALWCWVFGGGVLILLA